MSIETIAKTQPSIDLSNNFSFKTTTNYPYRITLIHPSAGINWSGGTETFAIEIARRLSNYFEVELLSGAPCGSFSRPAGGISRNQLYQFIQNPLIAPLLSRVATHPEILLENLTNFFPCVLKLLHRPAELIFPCNDYGGLVIGSFMRAIQGTPVLYTEHASLMADGLLLRRNLRFPADHLVVFSQEVANYVHQLKPTQPISILPNGVDLEHFTPHGERLDLGLTGPIVLCVAFLKRDSHKRVELAIEAMARLGKGSLLICGDGADRDYFKALGHKLLGPKRFAIRTFPHEQMPTIYRSVDAFTLPSLNEPFGLAYTEAMASGLPVVATDDSMRRYIVADSGVLCDVTNADIYAEALDQVLQGNWQQKARQNAMRFGWEAITLRYRDLILQLIHNRNKGN